MNKRYSELVLKIYNKNISYSELVGERKEDLQNEYQLSDEEYEELVIQYVSFLDDHIAWFEHIRDNSMDEDESEDY